VAVTRRGFWIPNFLIRFAVLRQFSLHVRGKRYKKLTTAYVVGADATTGSARRSDVTVIEQDKPPHREPVRLCFATNVACPTRAPPDA
jgi:hypothetical protein